MSLQTTRVISVTVPVADQDEAIAFYVGVLGFELREDVELFPGGRWVEVVPPGSSVGIALLKPGAGIPIGVRLGTPSADEAHAALTSAGASVHEDVLRLDFAPPMFTFDDPERNLLIYIEDAGPELR
jgi:catechol 2,3-dioxygenase-like lactoylglutathione lyase family enzyme